MRRISHSCRNYLDCIVLHLLLVVVLTTLVKASRDSGISPSSFTNDPHKSIIEKFQLVLPFSESQSCNPTSRLRKRVSLPVDDPTKSFWLDTKDANPLADEGSTGELTRKADVCVIGSGMTGVSAAWHLAKMLQKNASLQWRDRASVVILEARQFCSGATGRNGGNLTPFMFSSFLSRQAAYNTSEAVKSSVLEKYTTDALVRFITTKNLTGEVDLVERGHITLFQTKEEEMNARRNWEAAKAAGLDVNVTWIGRDEMTEKYGLNRELSYSGVFFAAYNFWPCKLVTHLFRDAQSSTSNVDISLHTKAPVTAITREDWSRSDESPLSSTSRRRRWKLHTPRGDVSCSYVIHATNAYASHLLPFLAGVEPEELTFSSSLSNGGGQTPLEGEHSRLLRQQSKLAHVQAPRGIYGIVPTRDHVSAIRAAVASSKLGWQNSWDVNGDGGLGYWFPRHQEAETRSSRTLDDKKAARRSNPVIILGGGNEAGIADDSSLNPSVSKALASFLPSLFPGQFFDTGNSGQEEIRPAQDGQEMEWTGIMGFTKGGDPFVGPVVSPFELETGSNTKQPENPFDGQYIAAGYSGHGMPRAYACAEVVAGMINAQIRGEKWTKPSWLPERYLTWAVDP